MPKTPKREGRGHILKGHINLSSVYTYLKSGQYPPGLSDCDKRAVRKRAKSFCLTEGDLYFIEPSKKKTNEEGEETPVALRVVLLSEEERRKAVLEAHIDPEGNHYGIEKTSNSLKSRYYWVGISYLVRDIISNCAVCQASRTSVNPSITPSLSKLFGVKQENEEVLDETEANTSVASSTPLPTFQPQLEAATYFWEKVELQIMGPYMCGRRKLYIAVAIDIFSLWPEVTTLSDKTPSSITHFLLNLVCRYGVMKSVILRENDDVKFGDVLVRSDLLSQVGIELSLELYRVSETADVWEEVENSISTLLDTHPETWSQCLELCMLPHRVSRPQRAEYTPAYLAHGREFNLPLELSKQDSNSYIDVHMSAEQQADSIRSVLRVYEGYSSMLRTTESSLRTQGGFVFAVDPGNPCPTVKVASATVTEDDADNYKTDSKTLPKNSVVKTVSVGPPRPLEKGQKRLVVVSLVERPQKSERVQDTEEKPVVKMEADGSDVDDGAIPTNNLDPDYLTSSPIMRRGDKGLLVTSDRVTRRSGRRTSHTPMKSDEVAASPDSIEKVFSESHGLGFGMEDLDTYYSALEDYKKNGKYPDGFTTHQKRVLRQISKSYVLLNNTLYYLQGAKGKMKVAIKMADERLALLHHAHITETGSHVCRSKVIDRLDSWNVYWKGLTLDCEAFVRACASCEHGKERHRPDTTSAKQEDTAEEDDLEMIVAEQESEDEENYEDITEYLKSRKFPDSLNKTQRGKLRRRSKYFHLVDEVLHHGSKDDVKEPRRVLTKDKERKEAIREIHSGHHYGKNRTYNQLREKFYWRGMTQDVTDYVKSCGQCEARSAGSEEDGMKSRMSDRVDWFRDKMKTQDLEASQVCIQSLIKTEVMETEEIEKIPDVPMATITDGNEVVETEKTQTTDKSGAEEEAATEKEDIEVDREGTSELSEPNVQSDSHENELSETLPENTVIVIEPLAAQEENSPCEVVLLENHQESTNQIASVSQSGVDKEILVSQSQVQTSSEGPVISVTTTQTVDSGPGSVQMMLVSEQWNPSDLNILNQRVRLPYQCERVSVEQIQDEHDQVILSDVNKAALSSGNALAELVKATVGDLTGEESVEKSETVSAVASIPTDGVEGEAIEVDEDEDEEEEDEEGKEEGAEGNKGTVTKRVARYTCDVCQKEIKGTVKFKMHMYKHTGVKPFNCDVCSKKFTNNKSLRIHMRIHTGDMPYLCSLCGKGFSRSTSLRYHLKAHDEGGGVPVSCDLCGREFTTVNRLEKHKEAKHPAQAPVYQCHQCHKIFTAQRSLKRHLVSHQGIRSYQCQICGRGFFRKEYLNSHLVQHPEAYQPERRPRVPKKKKPMVVVDPNTGLEVQSMVQVPVSQEQSADSTAFVFPQESVQYEVECLTSESTLTEADLKAIHFLAQASIHGQF